MTSTVGAQTNNSDTSFYSIIAPETIRPNRKYNVAVSVYESEGPCEFKISLKGSHYQANKNIKVQPMTTDIIEFDIPAICNDDFEIIAEGLDGIEFKRTATLSYGEYSPLILIQTDKATYKPGDLVQFRVLFMDDQTRPMEPKKPITISINDGEQNRLKHWQNVELKKGVYVGKYQLSEQPVLGQWVIEVNAEDTITESKTFEVDKYVLPKFDVTIETAKDVAIDDDIITATIRSKYTYGRAVKGKALVTIKPMYLFCGTAESTKAIAEKSIDIDGKAEVEFKIGKDLKIDIHRSHCINLTAVMEEELTGNKQEATTTIQLHDQRYRCEGIDIPNEFHAGKPLTIRVSVKHVDNTPVLDTIHTVKLTIGKQQTVFRRGCVLLPDISDEKVVPIELTAHLDDHGIATFDHTFPMNSDNFYCLSCEYQGCESRLGSVRKYEKTGTEETEDSLNLTVVTKKPKLGEKVEVLLKSDNVIPYLIYTVTGRGKLLKNEFVALPENVREYTIEIEPTFDMVPVSAVFLHYVVGKDFKCKETVINFDKDFENYIDISAPTEAQLGENIAIEVRSNPDSYVGVLGVDQSVLLLRAGNDLNEEDIFNGLQRYDSVAPWRGKYYSQMGATSGLTVMTNGNFVEKKIFPQCYAMHCGLMARNFQMNRSMQNEAMICADSAEPAPVIQIRKEFPENWIFEDIESLTNKTVSIQKTVPDTITSWVITGFSLNPETGFAITKNPSTIKTFRPFFIGTNLPYSIKRGEIISIPVIIFNYMEQDLETVVTLDNSDNEFDFIEIGDDGTRQTKKIFVTSNNGGNINFIIRPKIIGQITLKITAVSPLAGDAIHKKLKVEPEGITIYKNRDHYIYSEDGSVDVTNTMKLDIPLDVVPDSEFIEVSIMGNMLSSTLSNIDKLVRMPYGCGEQNMVNFVPNIFVLWYLESIQGLTKDIEVKAKGFMEIGYQRELTYKHDNGSYSAFGKSDSSGSTWLTAYVIRSFHQAKKYIDIDPKILEDGLNFLAKTQSPNGSFPEVGRVLDFSHMSTLGLTAFVLLAFLENDECVTKHQKTIERGFEYLKENVNASNDLYSLAVAVYALKKGKSEVVNEVLAKLKTLAHVDGGLKWWGKEKIEKQPIDCWRPSSHDVEITGYILMTLLEMDTSVLPIIKWLTSQRNSNGGFESSQDTVVGLWALIKFAEKTGVADQNMSIKVNASGSESSSKIFDINKENSMALQSWELPKDAREVTFTGIGAGTAIIQVSYRYNILEKETKPSFKLNTEIKPSIVPSRMSMNVHTEFVPEGKDKLNTSNMVVMEVALPSGYTAVSESFDKIKDVPSVKRVETKDGETCIIVYFDNLKESEVKCIPIEAVLTHEVAEQKPVPIIIYDYYDNNRRATEFYEIENSPVASTA